MDLELGTTWRAAVIVAVGGTVAAVAGALIAAAGNEVGRGYVMRAVVMTVVVLGTVVVLAARSVRLRRRHTFAGSVMVGATIGFLVDPAMWSGRAYLAQPVMGPGPLTAIVDLLVLLIVTGALTVTLGARLVRPDSTRSLRQNSYVSGGSR